MAIISLYCVKFGEIWFSTPRVYEARMCTAGFNPILTS